MAANNVFKYNKRSITRDEHVDSVMEKILSGTSDEWKEWKKFIEKEEELHECLEQAVTRLVKYYEAETKEDVLPSKAKQILAALRYCKPEDVKVIILGHDPAYRDFEGKPLATGLAFSFPDGATENKIKGLGGSGRSVVAVHDALKLAYIEPGESCCHVHWAKKGVLLLNACLTIDPKNRMERKTDDSGEIENPHFKYWKSFIYNLLLRLLRKIDKKRSGVVPVYVLCWGTHARDVGRHLKSELGSRGGWGDDHAGLLNPPPVIFIGHHPTYPTGDENKFSEQATNQFELIMKYKRYGTLFDQETQEERRRRKKKEEEEEEEEKEEERRKKKEVEERRKEKEDHQDDVNQLSDTVASGMHINK